jgi:hypothetical protein
MHRIDGDGNDAGMWTNGNPGIQEATVFEADWANAVQEELVAVATANGAPLNKANNSQVIDALDARFGALAGGNTWSGEQVFADTPDFQDGLSVTAGNTAVQNLSAGVISCNTLTAANGLTVPLGIASLGVTEVFSLSADDAVSAVDGVFSGDVTAATATFAGGVSAPNTLKAFAVVESAGTGLGGLTLRKQFNVASVTLNADALRITFAVPFTDIYYVPTANYSEMREVAITPVSTTVCDFRVGDGVGVLASFGGEPGILYIHVAG